MYKTFYKLDQKPFQITTDPTFLWMGEKHREALGVLKYGVLEDKGFVLLTGDVGTGKTTLVHALINTIKDSVHVTKIPDPGLSKYDFYKIVSRQFGIADRIKNKSDFLEKFGDFLNLAYQKRKKVILIIDESQRLTHDMLEEIRLLSNIEKQNAKLLTILFVGQNEFNALLLRPENRALRRRITITYNLNPLSEKETGLYIRHRLKTAGAKTKLFAASAIEKIYDFSLGSPRQINIICDLALLYGFEAGHKVIRKKLVKKCLEKISFPVRTSPLPPTRLKQKSIKNAKAQNQRAGKSNRVRGVAVAATLLVLISSGYVMISVRSDGFWKKRNPKENRIAIPIQPARNLVEQPIFENDTLENSFSVSVQDQTFSLTEPVRQPGSFATSNDPPAISYTLDYEKISEKLFETGAYPLQEKPSLIPSVDENSNKDKSLGNIPKSLSVQKTEHENEPDPSHVINWLIEKKKKSASP